jgi:hypothetical protein
MKRLRLLPWMLLLTACSLPFGAAPTEDAPAATLTPIGVALPPVWTPTPPSASQPTVEPTTRAEQPPTETPEIDVPALRLSDLPAGYAPSQPISYGLSPAILAAGVLHPQSIAMFEDPASGTLVISVAALLGTSAEEDGFARWIETPTTLIEVLAGVLGRLEGSARVLDGFSDIGTASAAAEGTILYHDSRYSTQVVLLRQGSSAAYIALLLPRGAQAGFDLQDLVRAYSVRLRVREEAPDAPAPPAP